MKGIDVSHWQGKVDWKEVAADGVKFVFLKATEAVGHIDKTFLENAKGAKAAGLHVGAYHFARFKSVASAQAEARHFLLTCEKVGLDWPLVLDLEVNPGELDKGELTMAANAFLQVLEDAGRSSALYVNKNYLENFIDASKIDVPIWLARYRAFNLGPGVKCDVWQYTDKGKVSGIKGDVDMNHAYTDLTPKKEKPSGGDTMFKPFYDKRNRDNIAKLAPNTRKAALVWYEWLIDNEMDVLIYETIRTKQLQQQYVATGKSQTMKSYHLVGQALDFVPVDSEDGSTLWGGYGSADMKKAVAKAKALGFVWGGDWASFVDKPHLQYEHRGYGTDKGTAAAKPAPIKPSAPASKPSTKPPAGDGVAIVPYPGKPLYNGAKGMKVKDIERIQRAVGVPVRGKFDLATKRAVTAYQKRKGLDPDGVVGRDTWNMLF